MPNRAYLLFVFTGILKELLISTSNASRSPDTYLDPLNFEVINQQIGFVALFFTLTIWFPLIGSQREPEWLWSHTHVAYNGSTGLPSISGNLNLATMVIHRAYTHLENEWGWDRKTLIPLLKRISEEETPIGCRMINRTTNKKVFMVVFNSTLLSMSRITKPCTSERSDCWLNFTLMEPTSVTCLWQQKQPSIHHRPNI